MSPFVFLLVPVVIIVLASFLLWVRGRQPTNMHSGIHGFQQEMRALSPDAQARKPRRFESDGTSRPTRPGPGA
ncbi:MAG TPA: hypothetical protein VFU19_15775 [Iamia sp.]|nr:hypothetical protein [Iamia sp.]